MPAPTTTAEFVDFIRRSGVIDDDRLYQYLETLKTSGTEPAEPAKFAGRLVSDGIITYFQAEQFLQGKWKRFNIGKYRVLERIGSGGMGQVFLCEHKLMRRRVAVKVLPTARSEDQSSLDRFYREARAVAALDHPNLVRAYDIDQDEALHFLVMEFVDGSSFHELVKKCGPMDPLRACHYIHQSAVGLDYANGVAGIVHRDIKPANILVDRGGMVKILDMGLARFFNDEADVLTRKYDETVLGTADYLAPEQAIDSHTVDIRADIYSLGATFYYILTGQPPFPDGTVAQKLIWHQSRQPRPIRELRPEISQEIAGIIEKMMQKLPDDRYESPADVALALAPLTSTPIPPPSEEEMPQLSPAAMNSGSGPTALARTSGRVPVLPAKTASSTTAPRPNAAAIATADSSRTIARKASAAISAAETGVNDGATPPPANPFSHLFTTAAKPGDRAAAPDRNVLESVYAADTAPRPADAVTDAEPPRWNRTGLLGAAAGLIAILATAVGYYFFAVKAPAAPPAKAPQPIEKHAPS